MRRAKNIFNITGMISYVNVRLRKFYPRYNARCILGGRRNSSLLQIKTKITKFIIIIIIIYYSHYLGHVKPY